MFSNSKIIPISTLEIQIFRNILENGYSDVEAFPFHTTCWHFDQAARSTGFFTTTSGPWLLSNRVSYLAARNLKPAESTDKF